MEEYDEVEVRANGVELGTYVKKSKLDALKAERDALYQQNQDLKIADVANAFKKLEQTQNDADNFSALNSLLKAVTLHRDELRAENNALKEENERLKLQLEGSNEAFGEQIGVNLSLFTETCRLKNELEDLRTQLHAEKMLVASYEKAQGPILDYQHYASVIMVGDRYFNSISQKGMLMTAWSLAGAKLFLSSDKVAKAEIASIVEKFRKKGKTAKVVDFTVYRP